MAAVGGDTTGAVDTLGGPLRVIPSMAESSGGAEAIAIIAESMAQAIKRQSASFNFAWAPGARRGGKRIALEWR